MLWNTNVPKSVTKAEADTVLSSDETFTLHHIVANAAIGVSTRKGKTFDTSIAKYKEALKNGCVYPSVAHKIAHVIEHDS